MLTLGHDATQCMNASDQYHMIYDDHATGAVLVVTFAIKSIFTTLVY